MKSQELFERSQKVSPGGVHSPVRAFKSVGGTPLFFKTAQGPYVETVEGDKYVDFCQSFGPNILGHRDPDVQEKVLDICSKVWSLGACEPYSLELAEWMAKELPFLDKFRFVCSGTEAVMSALRVARGATGRSHILKFNGCYHGHVDGMLVKSGSGLAGAATSDSKGVSAQVASETLICEIGDIESVRKVFAERGSDIAALILEPLPANYGLLIQEESFIQEACKLAKDHGALVIFDEVISGFRVDMQGMAGLLGIEPDLVTYGKIIGGGFPVGCYAGKAKYMDEVAPQGGVYQAGTLAGSPIGMVAGLATLSKLKSTNGHQVLKERTQKFVDQLNEGFQKHRCDLKVVSFGSLFWIHKGAELTVRQLSDFASGHAEAYGHLFSECLKRGIYFAPSSYEVGFVSLAHSEELLEECALKIIEAAVVAKGLS